MKIFIYIYIKIILIAFTCDSNFEIFLTRTVMCLNSFLNHILMFLYISSTLV